jgi:hypothetical protein
MNLQERKAKVSKLVGHLSARFSELQVPKTEAFWKAWENFDSVCAQYIQGQHRNSDKMEEAARELYCYAASLPK